MEFGKTEHLNLSNFNNALTKFKLILGKSASNARRTRIEDRLNVARNVITESVTGVKNCAPDPTKSALIAKKFISFNAMDDAGKLKI